MGGRIRGASQGSWRPSGDGARHGGVEPLDGGGGVLRWPSSVGGPTGLDPEFAVGHAAGLWFPLTLGSLGRGRGRWIDSSLAEGGKDQQGRGSVCE